MIETALVDGDIVAYRCAAATENEDENIAVYQTSEMMRRILHETNAMGYKCFLSGSNNFRYGIYPEYKANRKDAPKPKHLQLVREHLVSDWNASVTDGIEADDAMGIEQCLSEGTIICSIDKDMLTIPGQHYNFVRLDFRHVSPLEAWRNFYFQLIMGDRADNIFGYDGIARQKVPKFLEPEISYLQQCQTVWEMYEHVRDMYDDLDRMHMNARVLYIWRKENDEWEIPNESKGTDSAISSV